MELIKHILIYMIPPLRGVLILETHILTFIIKLDHWTSSAVANLSVEPDGLVAFGVDIIRVQGEVGQLPLQALSFDLLKGGFANEVSRLNKHRNKCG